MYYTQQESWHKKRCSSLHMDHLGPMDATCKQYKHILAMVDGFSKFLWLFPTKSTGAEEVVRNLNIWSQTFGSPVRIISDKGPAFTSQLFQDWCNENVVDHILTTTGVPRGNGQIERVNRSILSVIAKLSAEDTTKWYKFEGEVQKALNSSVHSSTKSTPFEVTFGIRMKTNICSRVNDMLQEEIIENYNINRQQLRDAVKQQIIEAQKKYKFNFDKHRKQSSLYGVSDLVAIKRTQFVAGRKSASEYLGPYKVDK